MPSSWVKGFRPPAKCPACKRLYTLIFTGLRNQIGDHVYRCEFCGSYVGAPTDYAECTLHGGTIEKDVFYSPCAKCPSREPVPGSGVCKWFHKEFWGDLSDSERISRTKKKFYIPNWGYKGEESE